MIHVNTCDGAGVFEIFEDNRLFLRLTRSLDVFAVICVEHEDSFFLGEVVGCTKVGHDLWRLEIRIEQILHGLKRLAISRALLSGKPFSASH